MSARSPLEQRLLHDPIPDDDEPGRPWAYSGMALVVLSLFIAYHLTAVLVHTMPASEGSRALQAVLARRAETENYLGAIGITWLWGVFAPEPPTRNVFTRVLVESADGQEWDLGHEILGRRSYPYLFYDRMAKINRQMLRQREYLRIYAGWVCRSWELGHGGEAARTVRLAPVFTQVPAPSAAFARMGYEPRGLDVVEAEKEVFPCASTAHGQLPPRLRARHGLAAPAPGSFRDVPRRSWVARASSQEGERAPGSDPASAPALE